MVSGLNSFGGVTSDCRPWPKAGELGTCRACGTVQKVTDEAWRARAKTIYESYEVYHQSAGAEQAAFDQSTGRAVTRSARLLERLCQHIDLPEHGRMLDIGCGNGAMLRSFGRRAPGWSLVGTELDDRNRDAVEAIPGVESLFTCPPEEVPGRFDLISMIHVLEHIIDPCAFLSGLHDKLEPDGLVLIQAPDYRLNPFDLLIADHCTHFSRCTLAALVERVGFDVVALAVDWVPKEITIVAGRLGAAEQPARMAEDPAATLALERHAVWLRAVSAAAREAAAKASSFGLFGTAIAATWLAGELGEAVDFFVDEDPHRAGGENLGRPVYHPRDISPGATVFLALPPEIAAAVRDRLARPGVAFCTPPEE